MKKPKARLIGEDGNIFNLVAIASNVLKRNSMEDKADQMKDRVFIAESYNEALNIISEYVDIV